MPRAQSRVPCSVVVASKSSARSPRAFRALEGEETVLLLLKARPRVDQSWLFVVVAAIVAVFACIACHSVSACGCHLGED